MFDLSHFNMYFSAYPHLKSELKRQRCLWVCMVKQRKCVCMYVHEQRAKAWFSPRLEIEPLTSSSKEQQKKRKRIFDFEKRAIFIACCFAFANGANGPSLSYYAFISLTYPKSAVFLIPACCIYLTSNLSPSFPFQVNSELYSWNGYIISFEQILHSTEEKLNV